MPPEREIVSQIEKEGRQIRFDLFKKLCDVQEEPSWFNSLDI